MAFGVGRTALSCVALLSLGRPLAALRNPFGARRVKDLLPEGASPAPAAADVRVGTVLGTMTFGSQTNETEAAGQLSAFADWGGVALDSARMYVRGETEEVVGTILGDRPWELTTKANPFGGYGENLTAASVEGQLDASLAAMGQKSVEVFYLHAPDHKTALAETLEAVQRLYRRGKFRRFGLSNYPAWQVAYIHAYRASRGYVTPTIYQGMFNAITRDVERELLPALRALGMAFEAYNPLAGGLLTGRYEAFGDIEALQQPGAEATRFNGAGKYGKGYGQMYQDRFWTRSYFEAIDVVRAAAKAEGVGMADAALRWLYHHSPLSGEYGDRVILGGSKLSHVAENLASAKRGPLPQSVVDAYEEAWRIARKDCPQYFR